jgi:hypothetical protein
MQSSASFFVGPNMLVYALMTDRTTDKQRQPAANLFWAPAFSKQKFNNINHDRGHHMSLSTIAPTLHGFAMSLIRPITPLAAIAL